jgi:hypothetical protein
MAEELQYTRVGTSKFADEGTAAHTLLADCLLKGHDAALEIGRVIHVDTLDEQGLIICQNSFPVDDGMAAYIQTVIDSVRVRVEQGWTLLVEQRVDFSNLIGIPNQFGTADIILISPDGSHVSVEDLKYGRGHKVYPKDNHQMLTYAAGVLETFDGLLGDVTKFDLRVHQPRLNFEGSTEQPYTRDEILAHAAKMKNAAIVNAYCIGRKLDGHTLAPDMYKAGPKTCLWCKHKPNCAAHEKMVLDEVMQDFNDINKLQEKQEEMTVNGTVMPKPDRLGQAFANLDMIEEWCRSVRAECERQVFAGMEIIGIDGKPLKLIGGRMGDRKWDDEAKAEALLVGCPSIGPEKAYAPRKIISASQAAKILDKKKTAAMWATFKENISQAPGKPKVVEGSHPGEPWSGAVQDSEFVDLSTLEE